MPAKVPRPMNCEPVLYSLSQSTYREFVIREKKSAMFGALALVTTVWNVPLVPHTTPYTFTCWRTLPPRYLASGDGEAFATAARAAFVWRGIAPGNAWRALVAEGDAGAGAAANTTRLQLMSTQVLSPRCTPPLWWVARAEPGNCTAIRDDGPCYGRGRFSELQRLAPLPALQLL